MSCFTVTDKLGFDLLKIGPSSCMMEGAVLPYKLTGTISKFVGFQYFPGN